MSPIKEDHNMKKTMSKVTEKTTFTWEDLLEKLLQIFETDEVNEYWKRLILVQLPQNRQLIPKFIFTIFC